MKFAEREVYCVQISIYLILLVTFIFSSSLLVQSAVLLGAVIFSTCLTMYNIFVLGGKNKKKKNG